MTKHFLILGLLLAAKLSHGGAGWIGNSPALAGAHVIMGGRPSIDDNPDTEIDESADPFSVLLLKKNQTAAGVSLSYETSTSDSSAGLGIGMSVSHGISNRWMYVAPLGFAYGILNNNGRGNELAVSFGVGQLSSGGRSGWAIGPGIGLEHTYGTQSFRFMNSLYLTGLYSFETLPLIPGDSTHIYNAYAMLTHSFIWYPTDKFSLGASVQSMAGSFYDYNRGSKQDITKVLTANPGVFVNYKFSEHFSAGMGLDYINVRTLSYQKENSFVFSIPIQFR